jgi:hypothetical protein
MIMAVILYYPRCIAGCIPTSLVGVGGRYYPYQFVKDIRTASAMYLDIKGVDAMIVLATQVQSC